MEYLSDTHTALWFADSPEKLPRWCLTGIGDSPELFQTSMVTYWEVAIKHGLGRLPHLKGLCNFYAMLERAFGLPLPLSKLHFYTLQALPHHHKDPFDRLLIAQAIAEGMTLVSDDSYMPAYPVTMRW